MPYKRSSEHGGSGGGVFSDDLTETCRLARVIIRHGTYVDAITPVWKMVDGKETPGLRHGGTGGSESSFTLEEGEFIKRVTGRSGWYIDQLTFYTSKGQQYGPYGGSGGGSFDIGGLNVGGFFGRSGIYLDAIGFFILTEC
jgi:Jacalin-like lectin domain.